MKRLLATLFLIGLCGCSPPNDVFLTSITGVNTEGVSYNFTLPQSRFLWRLNIFENALGNQFEDIELTVKLTNANEFPIDTRSAETNQNVRLEKNETAVVWRGKLASLRMQGISVSAIPTNPKPIYKEKRMLITVQSSRTANLGAGELRISRAYYDGL